MFIPTHCRLCNSKLDFADYSKSTSHFVERQYIFYCEIPNNDNRANACNEILLTDHYILNIQSERIFER